MAQETKHDYFLFVGTYSNAEKSNGIHVLTFDSRTGDFIEKSKFTGIQNPSFLAISADKKNLYAVSEGGEGKGLNAFSFDPVKGSLTLLNSGTSGGPGPCYVSVDSRKRTVFVGNYGGGSLSATRLRPDGSLSDEVQVIQHTGNSVNERRQRNSHVHAVVLSPDEKHLLVPDLGTDKVNVYRYDPKAEEPLSPGSPAFASANPGGGPRHLAFHPNGKFAYLVLEMEGAVMVFDNANGELKEKQSITMLAPDFSGTVGAADIHVSPDGKFLYASNRGDANDIVIYSIARDGKLTYVGRQGTGVDTPRNFAIDPRGNFLLVGNQNANNISLYHRDKKTGMLTPTGKTIPVDKPVCLKFVAID